MKKVYVTANDNESTLTVDNIVDPSIFFADNHLDDGVTLPFATGHLENKALLLGQVEAYGYEVVLHDGYAYLVVLKKEN